MFGLGTKAARDARKAWRNTRYLYRTLLQEGKLPSVETEVLLPEGEPCYLATDLYYARLYEAADEYTSTQQVPGLAQRTVQTVATQWGEHCQVSVYVTHERILCQLDDEWEDFWHKDITRLEVDFEFDQPEWHFVLYFDGVPPLRLAGADAPACALIAGVWRYGIAILDEPVFASFAE